MHTIAIYVCIYVYVHTYLCAYIAMLLHPCQFPSPVIRLSLLRVFCFMKFVAIEVFCFSIILFSHSYEQSYNHINNECNTFWPNKLSHFLVYVIFFYYCCCFFFLFYTNFYFCFVAFVTPTCGSREEYILCCLYMGFMSHEKVTNVSC